MTFTSIKAKSWYELVPSTYSITNRNHMNTIELITQSIKIPTTKDQQMAVFRNFR